MRIVQQAGAIAVRRTGAATEVFIVRGKKNPQDWIFPKGHIEPGEEASAAAARELLEEGGIVGRVADRVGVSRFTAGDRQIEVTYFLTWYVADGVATEQREKRWLPLPAAREVLSYADSRAFLATVQKLVER